MFRIKLASVSYTGQYIGNDLKFTLKIGNKTNQFQTKITLGLSYKPSQEKGTLIKAANIPGNIGTKISIELKVVEADVFIDDIGLGRFTFEIPKYSIWDKPYKYTVSVSESSKIAKLTFELQILCLHSLFAKLWKNHPAIKGIINPCSNNGKPNFDNQCAIRMSVAIVDSGINLDTFGGEFCWYQHGRRHILRAQQLADWLANQVIIFGNATKHRGVTSKNFADKLGIVFFRNFWGTGNQGDHIDIWNGKNIAGGSLDYFSRSEEVWFW